MTSILHGMASLMLVMARKGGGFEGRRGAVGERCAPVVSSEPASAAEKQNKAGFAW